MIDITARTVEEFLKMEEIVKGLKFTEKSIIKVFKGMMGYTIIDIHAFTSDIFIPQGFDICNVSFRLDKDFCEHDNDECFVIETSGLFNGENVTLKTYCKKNERPFIKLLDKMCK